MQTLEHFLVEETMIVSRRGVPSPCKEHVPACINEVQLLSTRCPYSLKLNLNISTPERRSDRPEGDSPLWLLRQVLIGVE